MFFIAWPDLDNAKKLDEQFNTTECQREAQRLFDILVNFSVFQLFATFLTFYRENFEVKLGELGKIMRFVEVMGVLAYVALISDAFTNYGIYLMFDHVEIRSVIKKEFFNNKTVPKCITDTSLN